MSIEAVAIGLHHSKATGTTKLVLLGIANHDSDGGAFPKAATLAKYANVHPRRIPAAIAKLVELGEVRVHYKEGGARNLPEYLRPNTYEFLVRCPPECDRTTAHRVDGVYYSRAQKGPAPATEEERTARRAAGLAHAEARKKRPVDNSESPSAKTSTSAKSSTGGSAKSSTRGSAEISTTKNHSLEPSVEPAGLALVPNSPAAPASLCWACGEPKASAHRTYCRSCEAAGLNNPMIGCYFDGCEAGVRRRTSAGQQFFDCGEHDYAEKQKTALDVERAFNV